jgi:UPF0042 nucleotide-binding protein
MDSISNPSPPSIVVVTGLSGAGKSVAIKSLEDLGFYCIDNLPLGLWDRVSDYFIERLSKSQNCAIGIDVRDPDFAERFLSEIEKVKSKVAVEILFLTADDEALLNRYNTTRRRHPWSSHETDLINAIRRERAALQSVEQTAHLVIDTSNCSPHELARKIEAQFTHLAAHRREMNIAFTSFGFQYGQLKSSDNTFDVRFLPNPHYHQKLRNFSGLDAPIQQFLEGSQETMKFLQMIAELLEFSVPQYYKEGKHYLRIGIGCTGGKHRSVFIADRLSKLIGAKFPQFDVTVSHRDL